jgi:hypothetical protein
MKRENPEGESCNSFLYNIGDIVCSPSAWEIYLVVGFTRTDYKVFIIRSNTWWTNRKKLIQLHFSDVECYALLKNTGLVKELGF